MGQYSDWLHYREVEQLLQSQLEPLASRLAQLQARAQQLQESLQPVEPGAEQTPAHDFTSFCMDNLIISALALSLSRRPPLAPATAPSSPPAPAEKRVNRTQPANGSGVAAGATPAHGAPETMSSALFAWSNLPNFGLQEGPVEAAMANSAAPLSQTHRPLLPLPHANAALLPEDTLTFLDQHALTDPQIELPHWLRSIANAASSHHPAAPVDQESIRTNRLVQRWIERWGRQPSSQQPEGENKS